MYIDRIDNGIFRLRIPFETFTTSVYFYVCKQGVAIIDSATYQQDVDDYIIPALEKLNISHSDVKYLLLTHNHRDHIGGLSHLSKIFKNATIGTSFEIDLPNRVELVDDNLIFGCLKAISLPGHTNDSYGFYDTSSKTLLSGDCLQLDGVEKYRNGICDFDLYLDSINKLKCMGIKRIVAAHEYDPLGSVAVGTSAVEYYLDKCISIVNDKTM